MDIDVVVHTPVRMEHSENGCTERKCIPFSMVALQPKMQLLSRLLLQLKMWAAAAPPSSGLPLLAI